MDPFTHSYVTCALWLADPDPGSGEWDQHGDFTIANLAADTLARMINDCRTFQDAHKDDLATVNPERAGANFYLDRNHHWGPFDVDDRDTDVYDRLSVAAKRYGTFELYLGDDGRVYGQ